MHGLVAVLIGFVIAAFGFLVMRNPMRLAWFAPTARGYYQRLVLDTCSRNQLRILGVLTCLFGLVVASGGAGGMFNSVLFDAASDAFLVLLWIVFAAACLGGLILGIVQLLTGGTFDWWRPWRTGAMHAEIAVFPPVTPKMKRESAYFTVAFCASVAVAVVLRLLTL